LLLTDQNDRGRLGVVVYVVCYAFAMAVSVYIYQASKTKDEIYAF